jgi:hypothetical protein
MRAALSLTTLGIGLVALLGIADASPPPAAPQGTWVGDRSLLFGAVARDASALDLRKMRSVGVRSVRMGVGWGGIQPSRGTFRWDGIDHRVAKFASNGIEVLPVLAGSASWVTTPTNRPPLDTPDGTNAWQEYLTALVARFGPGGEFWDGPYQAICGCDAPPVPITAWQIWNEPNLSQYFRPRPSPREYAQLVAASHDAITAQDPGAQIVLAGMPVTDKRPPWKFLDRLYGIPGFKADFDVAAIHPYAPKLSEVEFPLRKMHGMMARHGDGKKPLWLSEIGWGSDRPDRFGNNKGIRGQRRMLSRSFRLILHHQSDWGIGRVYWFDWRDPAPGATAGHCSFCRSAGLLRYHYRPKPAYRAYKRLARRD